MISLLESTAVAMSRMHHRVRRSAGDEGATVIETAFSCSILIMLLIGLCQTCIALYSYHSVSEAARDATRWAIVRGAQCTGLTNCRAENSDIQTHLQNSALPGITPAKLTTVTTWYYASLDPTTKTAVISSCGTTASGCNAPGNLVQVQVTYKYPLKIPWVRSQSLTMTSTSTMSISQ
jgi:Flp pilus assembly protein TadG